MRDALLPDPARAPTAGLVVDCADVVEASSAVWSAVVVSALAVGSPAFTASGSVVAGLSAAASIPDFPSVAGDASVVFSGKAVACASLTWEAVVAATAVLSSAGAVGVSLRSAFADGLASPLSCSAAAGAPGRGPNGWRDAGCFGSVEGGATSAAGLDAGDASAGDSGVAVADPSAAAGDPGAADTSLDGAGSVAEDPGSAVEDPEAGPVAGDADVSAAAEDPGAGAAAGESAAGTGAVAGDAGAVAGDAELAAGDTGAAAGETGAVAADTEAADGDTGAIAGGADAAGDAAPGAGLVGGTSRLGVEFGGATAGARLDGG